MLDKQGLNCILTPIMVPVSLRISEANIDLLHNIIMIFQLLSKEQRDKELPKYYIILNMCRAPTEKQDEETR